jgi:hypothetical protein
MPVTRAGGTAGKQARESSEYSKTKYRRYAQAAHLYPGEVGLQGRTAGALASEAKAKNLRNCKNQQAKETSQLQTELNKQAAHL